MAVASIQNLAYLAIAAPRSPVAPSVAVVAGPSPFAVGAVATPSVASAVLVPSARVQLSPLGQIAGAVGALDSALQSLAGPVRSGLAAARGSAGLTQAITLLDQSIASLAQTEDPGRASVDFLSSAEFSQRLLASSLGDTVNGRAAGGALGDSARAAGGGFLFDPAKLERAFSADPGGVVALLGDYVRNLDAFFAIGASVPDLSGLTGLGPGMATTSGANLAATAGLSGLSGFVSDYGTRQALAAFRANSLL